MNFISLNINHKPAFKIGKHFFYWIASLLFLTLFFGRLNKDFINTFFYVCWQLPIVILTTYCINYWLIPKLLLPKRLFLFFYLLIATIIVSMWLNALVTLFIFIKIKHYEASKTPYISFDFLILSVGIYLVILLAVALKAVSEMYKMREKSILTDKQKINTELKLKEANLKLLQAQLHPHFLFNTLNSLYSLCLSRSEETPDMVIKLSDMLDYALYQCNDAKVSLQNELDCIKNYIELESIRYKSRLKLKLNLPKLNQSYTIAPLILLPFIENCFKHGVYQQSGNAFINVSIEIHNGKLVLITENSFNNKMSSDETGYSKGVGLRNVKERLNLIYPSNYELYVESEYNIYKVSLKIGLDGDAKS